MKKSILIFLVLAVLVIISVVSFFYFKSSPKEENNFEINTPLIKLVVKEGDSTITNIKITSSDAQDFKLKLVNLENIFSLDESSFSLNAGEEKIVHLSSASEVSPGIYLGKLVIDSNSKKESIPVSLEVQSNITRFATSLSISPKFKQLLPGQDLAVDVLVVNMIDSESHIIEMTYAIRDFDNNFVKSEPDNILVKIETTVTKTITLPDDIPVGEYLFSVTAKEKNSISTSSYFFRVIKEEAAPFVFNLNYLIIPIFVFLAGIVLLLIYMFYERDKLMTDLRRQQIQEIRRLLVDIKYRRGKELTKTKKSDKKKVITKYKIIRKTIIKKVKAKQRKQRVEFKRLRKQKRKSLMKKKLTEWRNQGFNIDEFLNVRKKITKKEQKNQVGRWKKQGYKFLF